MLDFFLLIFNFLDSVFDLLNSVALPFAASSFRLGYLMLAFIVVGMAASVLWKGVKG